MVSAKIHRLLMVLLAAALQTQVAAGQDTSSARTEPAPLIASAVKRGEPLQIVSWICPPAGSRLQENTIRSITRENVPIYRLPEGRMERSGPCVGFTDLFNTTELGPGACDCKIFWRNEEDGPTVSRAAGFVVTDETTRAVILAPRRDEALGPPIPVARLAPLRQGHALGAGGGDHRDAPNPIGTRDGGEPGGRPSQE